MISRVALLLCLAVATVATGGLIETVLADWDACFEEMARSIEGRDLTIPRPGFWAALLDGLPAWTAHDVLIFSSPFLPMAVAALLPQTPRWLWAGAVVMSALTYWAWNAPESVQNCDRSGPYWEIGMLLFFLPASLIVTGACVAADSLTRRH